MDTVGVAGGKVEFLGRGMDVGGGVNQFGSGLVDLNVLKEPKKEIKNKGREKDPEHVFDSIPIL